MQLAPTLPLPPAAAAPGALRAERLRWLTRLRWVALAAVLLGALWAPVLTLRGLNTPVLLSAVAAGVAYNGWFLWNLRRVPERAGDPLLHMGLDFGALTLVLWASGGAANPFVSLYFVHVLIVSALSGRGAILLTCGVALLCASFLVAADTVPFLRISSFDPEPRFAALLQGAAFVVTFAAAAYVAHRSAGELSLRQAEAAEARRASRRDAEILHAALDRLEVGVEVLDADGTPRFQNRHLLQGPPLACGGTEPHACEKSGPRCPIDEARDGRPGSCRFAQRDSRGKERLIEMLSFPLSELRPAAVVRLHLDRTESVLAERRLLFAERLASLGRTVQGVAHELNTPLATIQTLAADMRKVLREAPPESAPLVRDLDESAALILDEMRRCRAFTQELLAGRDLLAQGASSAPCEVGVAVARAAALVFGTGLSRARLVVDPAVPALQAAIGSDPLVQIFVNLLQNAADVIEGRPGAKVRVSAGLPLAGRIVLHVDDDGPGLPAGLRDRLFEAFITTKPPGKGTGLGLYTARTLAADAGGTLTLEDRAGGGARARLELPRVSS